MPIFCCYIVILLIVMQKLICIVVEAEQPQQWIIIIKFICGAFWMKYYIYAYIVVAAWKYIKEISADWWYIGKINSIICVGDRIINYLIYGAQLAKWNGNYKLRASLARANWIFDGLNQYFFFFVQCLNFYC